MSSTVVTALYDIGRHKLQGDGYRPFEKYLDWFRHMLAINVPMVIFIPGYLQEYVQQHRLGKHKSQTVVIVREIEDLHWYSQRSRIQRAIDAMRTRPNSAGRRMNSTMLKCPEYVTALYDIIMFSKFDWMREVAEHNPFGSEYFVWMDAGTFWRPVPFDVQCIWPDPYKMRLLGDRFLIQDNNIDLQRTVKHPHDIFVDNWNMIYGYMMAGNSRAVSRIQEAFAAKVEALLMDNLAANDQNVLYLVLRDHPQWFLWWTPTAPRHRKQPSPGDGRMLPYELAIGTVVPGGYPRNEKLKILTVATREVPAAKFRRWETTAKYYGYNYEIMGREQAWEGWPTKTKSLYQRLQTITEPYVAMTDCTDIFFTGSADEMVQAFEATGEEAIVGGEYHMAYAQGNFPSDTIQAHFEKIKEGPQCFPNCGFLIGKTAALRKLIALHLDHPDDQAACFETIYQQRAPLTIDYYTQIVGNVPNYGCCKSEDYYEFDPTIKRYRSKVHGTTPQALHFPGWYIQQMDQMYAATQSALLTSQDTSTTTTTTTSSTQITNSNQWQLLGCLWIVILVLVAIMFILYPWPV